MMTFGKNIFNIFHSHSPSHSQTKTHVIALLSLNHNDAHAWYVWPDYTTTLLHLVVYRKEDTREDGIISLELDCNSGSTERHAVLPLLLRLDNSYLNFASYNYTRNNYRTLYWPIFVSNFAVLHIPGFFRFSCACN